MPAKTKTDLIETVAQETGMTKAKAKQAVDALLNSIADGLLLCGRESDSNRIWYVPGERAK